MLINTSSLNYRNNSCINNVKCNEEKKREIKFNEKNNEKDKKLEISKVIKIDELIEGEDVTDIAEAKKDKHGRWLVLRGSVFLNCKFTSVAGS